MFAQYFGQFLFNQGIVSAAELERALGAQKETRIRLGVLAIHFGYMTAEQVETVHETQKRIDLRFGEIAVMLGLLTGEQVSSLLSTQQSAHLALGQALIDQGSMTYETFAGTLQRYQREYSLSDEQFDAILNGSIEALLAAVLRRDTEPLEAEDADYVNLLAKNMIRFIDSDLRLERIEPAEALRAADWAALQPLRDSGRSALRLTALAGAEADFLKLASLYAEETVSQPDDMMEAAVSEFLNLHNGVYLVNLSNNGIELELSPQTVVRGVSLASEASWTTAVRVFGARVQFDLLLADWTPLRD